MTLSSYLIGIGISTILCWVAWILTLLNIDPYNAGNIGLISFFMSLFFALIGTLTIVGFYLRIWFSKNEQYYENITVSFRQAILISIAVLGLLGLQSLKILNIFDGILFVLSIILLESYFLARRS
ncbi:hypothetical protein COX95_01380 [bacterium CG_4_10_14_0_2_um_filter_33_32]|nr:MAG: hypothetical protein AUJ93_00730 [bacterium CG2_30_33_46]PIR67243.1 MAG: hypothetical protein COU50_04165 [bacterium CG10_big_fil_rev_8_21_14_0_10_33_18]PIW81717.1 MAG: hypothetical protein COZ97_00190 [bacterium CG_4_8_14_3_um_filter_33_28]PIY85082.1 MAG: hypothetical protein COY76_03910 [bacterium CG_4_10_14_0_8_um_filter_33_57]PIZ86455.1 MAG: hypothetical protein COX95_01380 [bacterium CG_4_10_14_0_2_um_filter_33_32]PJA72458.1 MAG: hypothetical protein CO152_01205 [bacterium CG_4_9_